MPAGPTEPTGPTTPTGPTEPTTPPAGDGGAVPAGLVNLALKDIGGVVSTPNYLDPFFSYDRLNDGKLTAEGGGAWVSATQPRYPYDITVSFANSATHMVSSVAIVADTGQERLFGLRWPRDVEILVSTTGTQPTEFTSVARTEVPKTRDKHVITFTAVPARYVLVRIHSNYGAEKYLEMSELEVWGDSQPAGGAAPTGGTVAETPSSDLPTLPDGSLDPAGVRALVDRLTAEIARQAELIKQLQAKPGE